LKELPTLAEREKEK